MLLACYNGARVLQHSNCWRCRLQEAGMVYVVPQYTRLHLDLYLVRQEFPPNGFRSTGAP